MRSSPLSKKFFGAHVLAAGALACLLAGPALAQQKQAAYKIAAGDVLSIIVYGDASLSGQYPVAPDGSIAYPILGSVAVSGQPSTEIAARLNKALAEYVPGLSVSVGIAQYAPVFLVGDVEKPGRYEFRPGMIAIELMALGGGVRRPPPSADNAQLQYIAARQEFADVALQIFSQEVRRARLEAEFQDRAFSYVPAVESEPSVKAAMQQTIQGEQKVFEMRKAAFMAERDALEAQENSFSEEVRSLTAAIGLHRDEVELLKQDVTSTKDLSDRGLTAKSNLREIERRLSAARRDSLELESYLARARQNQLALRQRRLELGETRKNEAVQAMQDLDLSLARMRARQHALLDTMAEITMMSDAAGEKRRVLSFSILRNVDGTYRRIAAEESAEIRPGDILQAAIAETEQKQEAAAGAAAVQATPAMAGAISSVASQR